MQTSNYSSLTKSLLLFVLLLSLLLGGNGCADFDIPKVALQKAVLDPLPSTTLHIHRTLMAKGALLKDLSGPYVDPRSVHLAAGQNFQYSSNKVYLRVLDRKGGGAELYALDIKPTPWLSLTDDPNHSSFKSAAANIFEVDAATFANTDRLILYPEGKEVASTSVDGGTSFRFLDHQYLRVQRPGLLIGTSTDTLAFRDISRVSFERNLHVSKIVIEYHDPALSSNQSMTLGLPNGGSDLRKQCNDLEKKLTRQANLHCEERYSSSGVTNALILPLCLLAGALLSGILIKGQSKKGFLDGCFCVLITAALGLWGAVILLISLAAIASDSALSKFLG